MLFTSFVLFIPSSPFTTKKKITERDIILIIKVGDSIFVKRNKIEFYKMGKVKLDDYQQRAVKYQYDKKDDFIEANTIYEKFFFKNRTSFIGTCLGIDTVTNGDFIMIKPSKAVTHPPKPKDAYDLEARKWYDKKYDILNESKLSKQFYVRASDIVLKNNDKQFK